MTGADWTVWPVESVSVRPIEVPAVMLVDQVKEVPVRPAYCWSAAAPGWPPGVILNEESQ